MKEFSFEKITSILEEFVSLGGKRIDITGGECLMRSDLNKIAAFAKQLGIKVEIVTNASLVTQEHLDFWKSIAIDSVAISLDGHTSEIYNHVRNQNEETFFKVLGIIKKSSEMGFYTKVNTVVFTRNLFAATKITKLAIDLGAHEHGFYYFSPVGSGVERKDEVADPIEWLNIIRTKLYNFKDSIKLSLEVPIIEASLAKKLNIGCFIKDPWHLQILPNGNVYPCAIMSAYDRPIGNIHESSLEKIWKNSSLRNGEYYNKNILPLMEQFHGCVNYESFSHLVKSGEYNFVCLCTKFKIDELI